ncbi:serine hydrolase domain-containing protein [Streptomyces sp. NPDC051684]|uniref:serine hydrolase domain-containing protein n=1 Tax=Streptomyces sp. NPDC051684 TaxID=3365670 RepID=UPI0037BD7161
MSQSPNTATHSPAGPDRPELRDVLQEIVDSGITGIQLRVHDERGTWAATAGAAELDRDAAPPVDGHVRIGSNTKTFTATLVLQLVAEGKVDLDAPAVDHLPEYDLDRRVTVRMLLQHTSGVFNHTGEFSEDGSMVPGIISTLAGKEWVDNRFHSHRPQDLARLSLSKPPRFEPGAGWSYSNTNYVLARLLVENVTGRPIAEVTRERILDPLGLTGTVVPGSSQDIPEPYAHAYYRYEDAGQVRTVDVSRQNPSWVDAGGDMISTTEDLHTFISALARGELLPAPLVAEMSKPHPASGFGLGLRIQQTTPDGGDTLLFHNGGHSGHAALMYSTADGSRTLTAALNYVDDAAMTLAAPFMKAQDRLVEAVFGS